MHKIEIVDAKKPIVSLKWIGVIEKKEALDIIPEILDVAKKVGKNFYFLVDTSELKLNNANEEFAEHQKAALPYIEKIAVVMQSSMTKLQVRKIAEASNNDKEEFFATYEEALEFLKKQKDI